MRNIIITPGGKKIIEEAIDLFGKDRVQGGIFKDPVHIRGLTDIESDMAYEWFTDHGNKVQVNDTDDKPITLP